MAAYNSGGSLTWAAVLNASQFNSGIQSMVAQMAYAQRASSGLQASLAGIAAVSFAAVVGGIAGITAAIYVSTKAASDWQKAMLDVAQLANINVKTTAGREQYNTLDRQVQDIFADVAVTKEELFAAMKPYAAADYKGETLSALSEITSKYSLTSGVKSDDIANLIIKAIAMNPGAVKDAGNEVNFANKLLSSISQSANAGVVTQEELITGLTAAGGSMKSWNLQNDIPRQLALLQTMGQYGLDVGSWKTTLASAAGTPGLGGPAKISEDLDKALKAAGVNIPTELTYATGTYESGKKKGQTKYKTEDIPYTGADIGAKLLGMDTESYKQWWDKDSVAAFTTVADKIASLNMTSIDKASLLSLVTGTRAAREFPKMSGVGAADYYNKQLTQLREEYAKGTLAEDLYQTKAQALDAQWQILGNRAHLVKVLLGNMFIGPVTEGVKRFSEHLSGTVDWLQKIFDSSLNPNKTLNSWKAINQVIDGIKQKFIDLGGIDFLKAGGVAAGLLLIATNLGTIKTAAGVAAKSLMTLAGVTLGPTATALLGLLGPLSAIGLAAAGVAVGLAAIGYSLAPEKFTYFNQLATEAINGVSVVVKQLYTDLSTGDWSAAATHLKDAFMATIAWLQGIDWGRLGSEIVTMIGDGAKAIIDVVLDIGGWIYDSLSTWVKGNGPYNIGKEIGDFITDGLKTLSSKQMWEDIKKIFGVTGNWLSLGIDIVTGIGNGLQSGLALPLAQVHDMFLTSFANLVGMAVGIGYDIANAIINGLNSATEKISSIISGWMTAASQPITVNVNNGSGSSSASSSSTSSFTQNMTNSEKEKQAIIDANDPGKAARIAQQNENARKSQEAARAKDKNIKTKNIETLKQNTTSTNNLTDALNEMYGAGNYIKSNTVGKVSIQSLPEHQVNELNRKVDSVGKYATEQWNNFWSNPSIITESPAIGGIFHPPESITDAFYSSPVISEPIKAIPDALNTGLGEVNNNLGNISKSLQTLTPTPESEIKARQEEAAQNVINKYGLQAPAVEERIRKEKEAAIEAKNITTSGATSSVNILKDGIFQSTVSWKDTTDYSSKNTISVTDFVNSTTRNTAIETSSITKKAVAESYSPVKIGLTESGQQISVIGKVAQQQFEQSGNKWMNDTGSAGVTFNSDTTSGGKSIRSDIGIAGDELIGKVAGLQLGGSIKGMFDGNGKSSSGYEDPIIKELGSTVASIIGGSIKGLFGGGSSTTQTTPDQLLRNVEDITCTGDRVMVNTGIYTSPTGEKSAFNPMDNDSTRLLSNKVEGEFNDMTCMGESISINGLKYTNPYGQTSYINPMEYNSGGGVLDYQQAATTTTQAATDSAKITTSAAKQSSEYQKGADNYHAQSILGVGGLMDQQAKENMRLEKMNRIESGNVWLNGVGMSKDAWGLGVDQTIFDEVEASNEQRKQARDYLGAEATVHSEIYTNLKNSAIEQHEVNTELVGTAASLTALNSSISSSAMNFQSAFQGMISGMYSYSSGGGAWGGTSANGMGGWIGTDSNAYHGSTVTGVGAFISDWVSQNGGSGSLPGYSMSWGAKGSLIEEPTRLIAGEKGRELLLPNNLTELFMKLAALGFNNVNGNGGSGDTVVIVNIDGEQVEKVVSRRQKRNLNLKGLKLH